MRFGPQPARECAGAILAHSAIVSKRRIRKGRMLTEPDIQQLVAAGFEELIVARLEGDDLGEDEAAERIAQSIVSNESNLNNSAPFTGRVNIYADSPGILQVDANALEALNLVDPAITLATLADKSRVSPGLMVGTLKIITYGVELTSVKRAEELAGGVLTFLNVKLKDAALIITDFQGVETKLTRKGRLSVESRLDALGIELVETRVVPHKAHEVANAIEESGTSLILLLTSSATSDSMDVGPEGLRCAGGRLHRFGIPVDPGNLLFHGEHAGRPVVGLPGCARSPALNGADWVLERIACGLTLSSEDIARMGVGGLLKEIPTRPQPRNRPTRTPVRPKIEVVMLAGGDLSRLDDAIASYTGSQLRSAHLVGPQTVIEERLGDTHMPDGLQLLNCRPEIGPGGMIGKVIKVLSATTDAAVVISVEGRIPSARKIDQLSSAFSPSDAREICRLGGELPGIEAPVLFGKRFFESLTALEEGQGFNQLIVAATEYLVEIDQ